MWDISTLQLAKLQFFSSLSFFAIFGLCTVGLGWLLVFCKIMTHRQTADGRWMDMYRFWVRIFALCVTVSLLGMVFLLVQSGALWPGLFVRLGPVSGPLVVLVAALTFVIKLFVVDIMLYRQGSLAPVLHSLFVLLAALGMTAIAMLLIIFQSWLHFPVGLAPDTLPLTIADWRHVALHSQAWHRILFMTSVCGLGVGSLMVSISASEALAKPLNTSEHLGFLIGAGLATVSLAALVMGGGLFGDELFRHSTGLPVAGVALQKLALGLLLLIGLLCLAQWAWYLKRRGDFGKMPRWLLHALVWFGPAGWLALWLVQGLLSLRDGQFFVHGLVTFAEAFSDQQSAALIGAVTVFLWLLFCLIVAGFVFLARRAARFGVVPVRKIRRTA